MASGDGGSQPDILPLLRLVQKLNTELDLPRLLNTILEAMVTACRAGRGAIMIFSGEKAEARFTLDRTGAGFRVADRRLLLSVVNVVHETGRRILSSDAASDPDLAFLGRHRKVGPLSLLCVPLWVRTRLIGAVYLDRPGELSAFGEREVEIANFLTGHAAVAIQNALLHQKTIRDRLTGHYNHAHFEERLKMEIQASGDAPFGVLMIDVDDFKGINDTYGHETGNAVLRHVSETLGRLVRSQDLVARAGKRRTRPLVARFGGDEFEVLLPGADRPAVQRVADRLVSAMAGQRLRTGDHVLRLSISVGGAVFPVDARDARSLMARADEALYRSKRAGKNRAALYEAPKP